MSMNQPVVVIGMDPHKRSVTIEVMTGDETVIGHARFTTDTDGYQQMLGFARQWPHHTWAVEGCEGIGRHVTQRLLADHEPVVDVPAKLSARMRMFATGQGRKTDDTDAHSIALVGVRIAGLHPVVSNAQLEVLRLLVTDAVASARNTSPRSANCTSFCWNSSPVARRRTCPQPKPDDCSPP
ncbi:IS110 family transposase [Propioniciclava flava]